MTKIVVAKSVQEIELLFDFWMQSVHKNTVFCLVGESGTGKTHFLKNWAEKNSKSMKYMNCSNLTPGVLHGIPKSFTNREKFEINQEGQYDLPLYWDNYDMFFLDELNRSDIRIANVIMNIISEKIIDEYCLKNRIIVTAMNEVGFVEDFSSDKAFLGRLNLVHFLPSVTEKSNIILSIVNATYGTDKMPAYLGKFKYPLRALKLFIHFLTEKMELSFRQIQTTLVQLLHFGESFIPYTSRELKEVIDKITAYDSLKINEIQNTEKFPEEFYVELKETKEMIL